MAKRLVKECHEVPSIEGAISAIQTYGEATYTAHKSAVETATGIRRIHGMNLGIHYDNGRNVYVIANTMEDHYAEVMNRNGLIPSTEGARQTW